MLAAYIAVLVAMTQNVETATTVYGRIVALIAPAGVSALLGLPAMDTRPMASMSPVFSALPIAGCMRITILGPF